LASQHIVTSNVNIKVRLKTARKMNKHPPMDMDSDTAAITRVKMNSAKITRLKTRDACIRTPIELQKCRTSPSLRLLNAISCTTATRVPTARRMEDTLKFEK
jgi:hypothetical protein